MVQERIYSYFERNHLLHVLFIFDKMNFIFTELEEAKWPDNYVYKVFDGAWFNIKYAIENTWKDMKCNPQNPEDPSPHNISVRKNTCVMGDFVFPGKGGTYENQ